MKQEFLTLFFMSTSHVRHYYAFYRPLKEEMSVLYFILSCYSYSPYVLQLG